MIPRSLATSGAIAILLGVLSVGPVAAAGPTRVADAYTDVFFDEFIYELCGIETFTTVTERWTLKEFPDGSQIFHVNRRFVPDDPRIPVEVGAATSFFAPDGSKTTVGKPTQLFYPDGGIRLLDAGRVVFSPEGDIVSRHGRIESLGVDLAPFYCPSAG